MSPAPWRTPASDRFPKTTELLGLSDDAQVGPQRLPAAWIFLLGLVVGDSGYDDDVVTLLPVHWSGHLEGCGELDGVEDTEYFVEVAAGGHRIGKHELDALVGGNDEDRADGGVVGGGATLARVAGITRQHIVELGDLEFRVADHRVVHGVTLYLCDVLGPFAVARDGIHAEADDLAVALGKVGLQLGHVAELSGTDRSEIFRMREEDGPTVADPFVELDGTLGSVSGKVGCKIVDAQTHCEVLLK